MNRLSSTIGILLAGLALFAFSSCDEDTQLEKLKIDVSQKSVTIPAEGGSGSVELEVPLSWEATLSDSWFSVSPTRGEAGTATLVFEARKNETGETRKGTATISAEGLQSVTITVSQPSVDITPAVPDTELGVSTGSLSFEAAGGTLNFDLTANKDWTASVANAPWLTLGKTSGNGNATISVKAGENSSTSSRDAVVTVVSEEKTVTVSVSQKGATPYLKLSWSTFNAEADGGELSLSIDSNVAWKAETQAGWVSLSQTSADAGYTTIVVTALENKDQSERSATVTFSGDGASASITVNQKAADPEGVDLGGGVNDWGDGSDIDFEGDN